MAAGSSVWGGALYLVACIVPPDVAAQQQAIRDQLLPEISAKECDAAKELLHMA